VRTSATKSDGGQHNTFKSQERFQYHSHHSNLHAIMLEPPTKGRQKETQPAKQNRPSKKQNRPSKKQKCPSKKQKPPI
jgi:hypothetical protein